MAEIKRMDLNEFREDGFLQEVNRKFFHPLGLALEVIIDDETGKVKSLGGIWDYRDDPEGITFNEGMIDLEKAAKVLSLLDSKVKAREKLFGSHVQPAGKGSHVI